MAIRWSRKGKRFYDDNTGYPVQKERAVKSSTARGDYAKARPAHPYILHPEIYVPPEQRAPGYKIRPISEEFTEELAQFDGHISAGMSFEEYLEEYETEVKGVDQEDQYSED